jgi:hypothetical protein
MVLKRNAQSLCVYNTHQISDFFLVMHLNKASSFLANIRTFLRLPRKDPD